jgi:hypothetical protein
VAAVSHSDELAGSQILPLAFSNSVSQRSRVADRDHDRANLRRSFVAGLRLPATLLARSDVISYTEGLPRRGAASSLSRIRAATLRPVVRASCLK